MNDGDWNAVLAAHAGAGQPTATGESADQIFTFDTPGGDDSPSTPTLAAPPQAGLASDVAEYLQRYVYALVDPRDGVPFYIGKGTHSRVLQHGFDAAQWAGGDDPYSVTSQKLLRINEIRDSGLDIDVWILRRGMSPTEYSAVEATVIDLLRTLPIALSSDGARVPLHGGTPLANKVRGAGAENGIVRLSDIIRDKSAPPLQTETPLLLITLGPWHDSVEQLPGGGTRSGMGFKPEWTDRAQLRQDLVALGESVCCWWTLNPSVVASRNIEHMVATYQGVTRALFKIEPGSARTISTVTQSGKPTKRSGFVVTPIVEGQLWQNTVGPYGHRVTKKRGEQAQFRYWPYA